MPISDLTPKPEVNAGPGKPESEGALPAGPADPLTVVRTSSSSARRRQSAASPAAGTAAPLPAAGEAIATFLLEEAIGVGGMGAVYRARDTQLDRLVAIKLLPLDQTDDPELVQRFYQEGRSAAQLDHENIARVYSIGRDGPHHYIAFEYIEGTTVRRRVDDNGPLPVSEAVDITLQIAQALVHAAERGVVHRDIKPSNIILTPQGRAKLVDMGLARRFERESDCGLTQSGMTLGTFDYISPEQARDPRDVDVRSDLYSLGCTIFHMLTGRPPFPGGTVLQKLLQHQEEPPPEIRSLNSSVPPELARLITRLLAKDRDRRIQSPEQLFRDLLVIAGHLGLAVLVPEQHAWIGDGRGRTWHHHLAWISPALGFLVVLAGLVWWTRELTNPLPSYSGLGPTRLGREEGPSKGRLPSNGGAPAAIAPTESLNDTVVPITAPSRSITVRPGDDLVSLIGSAPPRSIITLAEDGPYHLASRATGIRSAGPIVNRDLTIRAEAGTRPVLRFASDARLVDRASPSMLAFSGGNITIEGLTFEFDEEAPTDQVSAINGEDSELTIRGCMFRELRQLRPGSGSQRVAIRTRLIRTVPNAGDRPPAVFVDSCHFDGGQVAIVAEGPSDLTLRDCTLGPNSPSMWIDNRQAITPVAAEVRLRHSSFLTGSGPVFEIHGTLARVQVDDCVVAPSGSALPTLVAIDNARNLTWRGRSNLFGRMRAFLESTRRSENGQTITDFARWKEADIDVREEDSESLTAQVWRSAQPLQQLLIEQDDPTRSFELAAEFLRSSSYGARQGPFGARLNDSPRLPVQSVGSGSTAANTSESESMAKSATGVAADVPGSAASDGEPGGVHSVPGASSSVKPSTDQAGQGEDDPSLLPAMPPMTTTPSAEPATAAAGDPRAEPTRAVPQQTTRPQEATAAGAIVEGHAAAPATRVDSDEDLIRSTEQFLNVVNHLGSKGGTLKLACEADLELPVVELPPAAENGDLGQWQIESAHGGPSRPRLRFRPSRFDARAPAAWTALFNLRHGTLTLQGVDVLIQVPDDEAPKARRMAAFALGDQSGLTLSHCTVTVSGPPSSSTAIVIQAPSVSGKPTADESAGPAAVVRLEDSFLRSAGDGVTVLADRLLDLQVRNTALATDGSLLHSLGGPKIDRSATSLNVKLDRAVARTKGGLAFLEGSPDETELPLTAIEALSSIFSTAGQAALFRVEARQAQMDRSRDRIVWNADKVAYDQITTYRRDQVLQTGVSPRDYSRNDWRTAFEPTDKSPVVDTVKFSKAPERWRSACSLTEADFRLDSRSPAFGRGPDLTRIPPPPRADL
jgi:serine/threonine-protein kinase